MNRFLLFILLCISTATHIDAQQSNIRYQIRYNADSCWYDAYLITQNIFQGQIGGFSTVDAQFSIVCHGSDTVAIKRSYQPVNVGPNIPIQWQIKQAILNPSALPNRNVYGVKPNISGNTLFSNTSDTFRIFSFTVLDTMGVMQNNCGAEVRPYDNILDPNVTSINNGLDQYYEILGQGDVYKNNLSTRYPEKPKLSAEYLCSVTAINIDLNVKTSTCQQPLSYAWTTPAAGPYTTQDISISPILAIDYGNYKCVVTDKLGCKDSITVLADPAIFSAGPNQMACAGDTIVLAAASSFSGVWTGSGIFTIINPALANAQVIIPNTATGTYTFTYTSGDCSDDMILTVKPKPSLIINDPNLCVGETTTTIVNPTGGSYTITSGNAVTINATGLIMAAQVGNAVVKYTAANGCFAQQSVSVQGNPTISLNGPATFCVAEERQLSPGAGTWISSNPSVMVVSNTGLAKAISQGNASLTNTNNNGCVSAPVQVTVFPEIQITGIPISICIGSSITLPQLNGEWVSLTPNIAVVTNTGLLTPIAAGIALVRFTQNGTGCSKTISITVNPRPTVSLNGLSAICVGQTIQATPTTGGSWTSTAPQVASISNSGLITGLSNGSTTVIFTQNNDGCQSEPLSITVSNSTSVAIAVASICVGDKTTVTASTQGLWSSSDINIATVMGNMVTGTGSGVAKLTFTPNNGSCIATVNVLVNAVPVLNVNITDTLCALETVQLSPSVGGNWISNNVAVATITNGGLVTAVGSTSSCATFTFTRTSTGCKATTPPVCVHQFISASVPRDTLCIGSTMVASSVNSGTWSTITPNVLSVTGNTIKGIASGNGVAVITNTATGCTREFPIHITNNTIPSINISPSNQMCPGGTLVLTTGSSGTFTTSSPTVFSVSNAGLVTAISNGCGTVTFTQASTGCTTTSSEICVNNNLAPRVVEDSICLGASAQILPIDQGGSWTTTTPTIVSIMGNTYSGLAPGNGSLTYTTTAAGCSRTIPVHIKATPIGTINNPGGTNWCLQQSVVLSPSGPGWTSSNTTAITVNPNGVATGIGNGCASLVYTNSNGCTATLPTVCVSNTLNLQISETDICKGGEAYLVSSLPGTWTSSDPAIATVNGDVVTGVTAGTVTLTFIPITGTCVGSLTLTVNNKVAPTVSITGSDSICVGSTTTLIPNSGGLWASDNPSVASVTNTGLVTGLSAGSTTFVYGQLSNGCYSRTKKVYVFEPTITTISNDSVEVGSTITLSPSNGGLWQSTAPAILSVVNNNTAKGNAPGVASLIYSRNACVSAPIIVTVYPRLPCVFLDSTIMICTGSNVVFADSILSAVGTYAFTLFGGVNCDTLYTITIGQHPEPSSDLTLINGTIYADTLGVQYTWYICAVDTIIAVSTASTFKPTVSGSYYAIIDGAFCSTKTECVSVIVSGVENPQDSQVRLYPNPTTGIITIESIQAIKNIDLIDAQGKTVRSIPRQDGVIDLSTYASQLYIIKIQTVDGKYHFRSMIKI
jgi:trimeric autotransporter adhesin